MIHKAPVLPLSTNTLSPGRLFVTAWVMAAVLVAPAGWSILLAEGSGKESGKPEEPSAQAEDAARRSDRLHWVSLPIAGLKWASAASVVGIIWWLIALA